MNSKLPKALFFLFTIASFYAHAQEKLTLYYDEYGKGLDTKKKAAYYRIVSYDVNNKPTGLVQNFYPNGKLSASGNVINVDKFDDNRSHWIGIVKFYNDRGKLSSEGNYDEQGFLNGDDVYFDSDGKKQKELTYTHGNPAKDYYLVYDKKGNTARYSYLTQLPMRLSTTDKNIVPITQRKVIFQDDQPVQFYFTDGLSVAVKVSTKQAYGSYYEAYVTIENGSGDQFDYDPSDITATLINDDEANEGDVMLYKDYMKKVKRRQAWSAAFTAFANVAVATTAGYSSSTTNVYAQSSTGKSVAVQARTTSYDGAAQAAAVQNASNNMNALANQQYEIKRNISEGYLKKNTIFPNSRLVGFINIKFEKANHFLLNVPVNGKVYHFEF